MFVDPFTERVGPNVQLPSTPLEVFQLFFTSAMLDLIVEETNRYALSCMGEQKYQLWNTISHDDIKAYFGSMILMGLVRLPSLYDYWKKDPYFHYMPIAKRITRDRFLEIHRYLHFTDNSKLEPPTSIKYDRLGKIRQFLDIIAERFLSVYDPNCQCAIDEAMVPYKGRSSMKQYMPKKPVRRGLKVWMRADSMNGYVSEFQVYVGKEKSSEKGLGARVVKDLTRKITHRNFHIYCDNFFTSPILFHDLLNDGIYACGTVRSNRAGFPDDLKKHIRIGFPKRGENVTLQSKTCVNLTASVWQDTKPVTVIATNAQTLPLDTVQRKLKTGDYKTFDCPEAISIYNRYMGGVDKNDQLRQYYHVRLKCKKYYKYLFWMIFDVAVTNSFILAKFNPDMRRVTRSVKDFRTELAKGLLDGYCSRKRLGRRPSISVKRLLS